MRRGKKWLHVPSIQDFQGNATFKPSAQLLGTGFQRFVSCAMTIPCIMIHSFAQLHLENQIQQSFETPAIATYQNPY